MLELRDAIIARLKEPLIDGIGARVHPRNEFESVAQAGQQGPTLFVKFARMKKVAEAGQRSTSAWEFDWWVVLALRNARQTPDGLGAGMVDVSPMLRTIASRLQGWSPELPQHRPLEMITPPEPEYITGLDLIPLAFRCQQFISS